MSLTVLAAALAVLFAGAVCAAVVRTGQRALRIELEETAIGSGTHHAADQTLRKPSADGLCDGLQVRFEFEQRDAPLGQLPERFAG